MEVFLKQRYSDETVSIPQAVSTVATILLIKMWPTLLVVSIPQAVSTVATPGKYTEMDLFQSSFNTASGKHCCNLWYVRYANVKTVVVSIPQAVSTVATKPWSCFMGEKILRVSIPQAVSTVATYVMALKEVAKDDRFNTASGKHCCNICKIRWQRVWV